MSSLKFDLSPLLNDVNDLVEKRVNILLSNFTEKFLNYEETYNTVMSIANKSYKSELNIECYNSSNEIIKDETKSNEIKNENNFNDIILCIKETLHNEIKPIHHEISLIKDLQNNQDNKINNFKEELLNINEKCNFIEKLEKSFFDLKEELLFLKTEVELLKTTNTEENITLKIEEVKSNVDDCLNKNNMKEKTDNKKEVVVVTIDIKEDKVEKNEQEEIEEEEKEEEEEEEEEIEEEEKEEEEEIEEKEEEEEELFEIEIDDITYFTNNEENGIIYEAINMEEVGNKVGYLKEGEPYFY
jgi:hypothetical protein